MFFEERFRHVVKYHSNVFEILLIKGKLRFRPPQEKEHWNEDVIVDTDRLPNACMQLPDETFGNFSGSQSWNPNTEISEDCLYLNVYKPRTKGNKVCNKIMDRS